MNKNDDAGTVYRNKGTQSSTVMLRYRTEMPDAGMPKPAALASMPVPSYASSSTNEIKKDKAHLATCRALPIV
jgi:hypothetical protein